MFAKFIGILFIVIGGIIAISILFPLIGSVFKLLWTLIVLAIAVGCIAVGCRLIQKEY